MKLEDVRPVAGVRHRHVSAGGLRLHVAEAGEGPPLILLHGWPQHWWCWRHLIPPLAERYRVLAPDLRGWGWSDAPAGEYRKTTLAGDVLALMDAEGLDRVRLIGHDWGGYISFLLALAHPERIERMVVLDVPPPWLGRPRPRHLALPFVSTYQVLLAAPRLGARTVASPAFIRRLIQLGSGPGMRWSRQELDVYAQVLREPARAQASSACYRTFLTRELAPTLRRGYGPGDLHVPALLVMGERSALRAFDPQPSRNLPVREMPGAGHFLPEEAPERVLELSLAHLAG